MKKAIKKIHILVLAVLAASLITTPSKAVDKEPFDPIWPVAENYTITGLDYYGSGTFHGFGAIDIASKEQEIYAIEDGVVLAAINTNNNSERPFSNNGNFIILYHPEDEVVSYYGHLKYLPTAMVVPGDTVSRGQQIAVMGSTGQSTGTHTHFQVRKLTAQGLELLNKTLDKISKQNQKYYFNMFVWADPKKEMQGSNSNPNSTAVYVLGNYYKNLRGQMSFASGIRAANQNVSRYSWLKTTEVTAQPVVVSTDNATKIASNSVLLNGKVQKARDVQLEYTSYSLSEKKDELNNSEVVRFPVSQTVNSLSSFQVSCSVGNYSGAEVQMPLKANKTYYYQCMAQASDGTLFKGKVMSFKTAKSNDVDVQISPATDIANSNALLRGAMAKKTSAFQAAYTGFYLGTSVNNMEKIVAFQVEDYLNTRKQFNITCDLKDEANITLVPGQTYYYQTYVIDKNGYEACSEIQNFTAK